MAFQTLLVFAAIWTVAMIGVGANSVVCTTVGLVLLGDAAYVMLGSPLHRVLTSPRRQTALNRSTSFPACYLR